MDKALELLSFIERLFRLIIPTIFVLELGKVIFLMEDNTLMLEKLGRVLELLPCLPA